MQHSALWAGLRLRADLVSTLPVQVYRQSGDLQIPLPTPPVLLAPGGANCRMMEWLYSSQMDLDRFGNCFGLITARDGLQYPSRIELVPASSVTVKLSKLGVLTYSIGGESYDAADVWHERQYTVPGMPIGLSPIANAAMSVGTYLSAQKFVADWFSGGAVPKGHLVNSGRPLKPGEADEAKRRFSRIFESGGIFASGKDWEFKPIQAASNDTAFLQTMEASAVDIARFVGVPGDLIMANPPGGSITYANIGQRNLEFLILNLQPAVQRREDALSFGLLANPRFIKLDTSVLLRMDPATQATVNKLELDSWALTPDEIRATKNRAPLTPEQIAQFIEFKAHDTAVLPSAEAKGATP